MTEVVVTAGGDVVVETLNDVLVELTLDEPNVIATPAEQGPPGPAGPAGSVGAAGPQGPQGPAGPGGPHNIYIQPAQPAFGAGEKALWVQTGLGPSGNDVSFWIKD